MNNNSPTLMRKPTPNLAQEAEDLFLRLDKIYAASDAIAEIERTFKTLVTFNSIESVFRTE